MAASVRGDHSFPAADVDNRTILMDVSVRHGTTFQGWRRVGWRAETPRWPGRVGARECLLQRRERGCEREQARSMEAGKATTSRLMPGSCVELKDELDEKLERSCAALQQMVSGLSEKEAHDVLSSAAYRDIRNHEEVCLGLLYAILTDPANASRSYRDLTFVSRDGLNVVLQHLNLLILDRFGRLTDSARQQILWLVREMVRNSVAGVDSVCWNLLRQVAGGDLGPRNLQLAEALLDLFMDNRAWLAKLPVLVASVAYAFLRLLEDHFTPTLASLRQKEAAFVVSLLREHFIDCLPIGRDLVRLLQNVARVPEIEAFWRDLLFNPKVLSPHFTGILQLLQMRTSRKFLQSRLTPDMEKKIVFVTANVRFGMQKRYQEWFQKQYLATPESQSLRCDLIRFIVGVIHPTNELLCSDIIPRWAVIGWLLTTCTSTVAAANAKLALFYDWLFFDPEKDNIMNIEPAILVMHHSLRPHPAITATLLDFLCRIIPNFYPPLSERVRQGIYTSLRQIREKRVLASLSPLLDNPKLDRELRLLIRDSFGEFCSNSPPGEGMGTGLVAGRGGSGTEGEGAVVTGVVDDDCADVSATSSEPSNHHSGPNHLDREPAFSDDDDDDDDVPLAKVRLKERSAAGGGRRRSPSPTPQSAPVPAPPSNPPPLPLPPPPQMDLLEPTMRRLVQQLRGERDTETRCGVMESLVQAVIQDGLDTESAQALAACLDPLLRDHFTAPLLPSGGELDDETLEDSVGRPVFVLVRNLAQMTEEDPGRVPLLTLLVELQAREPRLAHHLFFFLKASKLARGKASVYQDFCQARDSRSLHQCLVSDLKCCQEEDVSLFCWLAAEAYSWFPSAAVGNAELLQLVVSVIDAGQLQELVCRVLQGWLVMFRKDSFLQVLGASLEWETWEQHCLWQLVAAHNIPLDYVLPLLPRLRFCSHPEALTAILLRLRQEKPTTELLRPLLARPLRPRDLFAVSALRFWSLEHEVVLAEAVGSALSVAASGTIGTASSTSAAKRKRGGGKGSSASAGSGTGGVGVEQVLAHLDHLRQACKQTGFFQRDHIQAALQQARSVIPESTKKRFSDLFALAEVEEAEITPVTTRTSKGRQQRKAAAASKGTGVKSGVRGGPCSSREPSDTDSDSSEEEEVVKPRLSKKRRKPNPVNSDSD